MRGDDAPCSVKLFESFSRMLPQPNPTVIFKELSDGAVLFAPSTEVYYGLNEVGAKVWQALPPATHSLDELCKLLVAAYPDAPAATIRRDVEELLESLIKAGLVIAPAESEHAAAAAARAS